MKNKIVLILKKINLLLTLSISILLFVNNVSAEENFLGFIESLEGKANKIVGDEKIKLNEFDQIFLNDKILVGPASSVVISFVDNSILTLESNSEIIVDEFLIDTSNPVFSLSIGDGKFSFESGSIAKAKKGSMLIKLLGKKQKNPQELEVDSQTVVIGLRGTLVSGSNIDDNKEVALIEDSMGNVGSLEVTIGEETTTVTEPSAGISLSANNETQRTILSEDDTKQIKDTIKGATIASSTQSEENIDRAIIKKLANGTIPDLNGDGVNDLADIEAYKAELLGLKKSKLDYVVEQSTDDLSLLSDIIVNSNSDQSMGLMENMMENNSESAALLMTEIVEQEFDIFSHVSSSDRHFENLRETIVTEMIQDDSDFVADTMAQMMAVGNTEMGAYMMNEITNTQPVDGDQRNLAMDVLATFTEVASDKMDAYMQDISLKKY